MKCERCQKEFECGAKAGNPQCWCMDLTKAAVPEKFKDCLCPECLKIFVKQAEDIKEKN
jgi:hypothetical protein